MAHGRVAIFGGGRVGTAMAAEMPNSPVIHRGQDIACEIACICWPAHALKDFCATHPIGARSMKVAFCNGAWAVSEGADHAGICYVRATSIGDKSTRPKSWRVGRKDIADALSAAGLSVVCSHDNHDAHLWGKCLYLLPLALACNTITARAALKTPEYYEWYNLVRDASVAKIGESATARQEPRVKYLLDRLPRDWRPSPSPQEVDYFREKLCAE